MLGEKDVSYGEKKKGATAGARHRRCKMGSAWDGSGVTIWQPAGEGEPLKLTSRIVAVLPSECPPDNGAQTDRAEQGIQFNLNSTELDGGWMIS